MNKARFVRVITNKDEGWSFGPGNSGSLYRLDRLWRGHIYVMVCQAFDKTSWHVWSAGYDGLKCCGFHTVAPTLKELGENLGTSFEEEKRSAHEEGPPLQETRLSVPVAVK